MTDDARGILYVVGTPLGNLEDLTPRARRVLGNVDLVACEDTRHTRKLLAHFELDTPTTSLHAHNEAQRTPALVKRLQSGDSIAVVSDAGMPGVSDPGARFLRASAEAGVRVEAVPGPSAVTTAVACSGLSGVPMRFEGFLPRRSRDRHALLDARRDDPSTWVVFESPRRVVETLSDIAARLGPEREVCVAREMTKLHEEWLRGPVSEVAAALRQRERVRGEVTIVVAGADPAETEGDASQLDAARVADRLIVALREQGLSSRSIRDVLVAALGIGKRDAYTLVLAADDASEG